MTPPTRPLAALLAAVTVLLGACGSGGVVTEPEQVDARVVVHSVLEAGADSVRVMMSWSPRSARMYGPTRDRPLSGATVMIISEGDTLHLSEQDDAGNSCRRGGGNTPAPTAERGEGCYVAVLPGGVRSGATYDLLIEPPGGRETVRGRTTVPSAPVLLEPAADAVIDIGTEPRQAERLDPVLFLWSGADPKRRLELAIRTDGAECVVSMRGGNRWANDYFGMDLTGFGSIVLTERWMYCRGSELAESYPAGVILTTFDEAYTLYREHNAGAATTPSEFASAGLTGALGVFGAAASTTVPVTLVVRPGDR